MKIKVVSSKDQIATLQPNERIVHFSFRPSNNDIFGLVTTCPKIEAIQIPRSYFCNISGSIQMFLKMQRIALLEGDVWGFRSDQHEYYEIPEHVVEKIRDMKNCGESREKIIEHASRVHRLSTSLVSFILKTEN